MSRAAPLQTLEAEHALWFLGHIAVALTAALAFYTVFWPGLDFWPDLLRVIPIMLMGGMCSEAMIGLMTGSAFNFALLCAAALVAHLTLPRSVAFDAYKVQRRGRFTRFPGPTIWQARLNAINMQRRYMSAIRPRALTA